MLYHLIDVLCHYVEADSLALRARRSLDSSEKKNLYENALELYSKALKSKADDQAGLINCGNALAGEVYAFSSPMFR